MLRPWQRISDHAGDLVRERELVWRRRRRIEECPGLIDLAGAGLLDDFMCAAIENKAVIWYPLPGEQWYPLRMTEVSDIQEIMAWAEVIRAHPAELCGIARHIDGFTYTNAIGLLRREAQN